MNKVALFISFIVASLGVVLLVLYLRDFEKAESGGEKVKLMVAKTAIERGAQITDDNVDFREVPIAYVEDRAIKWAEKAKVITLRLGNVLQPGQQIMWTDLTTSGEERRDLSALVTPGRRALTVRTQREDQSAALIRPGDYVDVFAVLNQGGEKRTAVLLLCRILVLAKGLETTAESQAVTTDNRNRTANERDLTLTLSLNPTEIQLIGLAAEKGKLAVGLRNPDDPRCQPIGDMNQDVLLVEQRRQDTPGIGRTPQGSTSPVRLDERRP